MDQLQTRTHTNTRTILVAGAVAAAIAAAAVMTLFGNKSSRGYLPLGYTPPGYTQPGYTPPGYVPPGYTPPGYIPPGYVAYGSFSFCSAGGITEGCCTTGRFAHDQAKPVAGSLIKATSTNYVYYYGSNGKRYVFPNHDVLVSWYEGFDSTSLLNGTSSICMNVREFPDATIAAIPIAGNVTIRPGAYIVKIASSRQEYVIERHHRIRRLTPNSLDKKIYPSTAAQRVRVVPDAFFTSYTLNHSDVTSKSDYDPKVEWNWGGSSTMERELGILP